MHGTVSPTGEKRLSDPRSILKSRQILNGAREIFLMSGYAEATMEEIAMKAKVSKGTLYNHFDSKDDLFLALIHSEAKRIAGELPSLDLEESNPLSALRQMGLAILKAMEAPATVATLRLIVGSLGRFPRLGEEFLAHSLGPSVEQIATYLNVHETAIGKTISPGAGKHSQIAVLPWRAAQILQVGYGRQTKVPVSRGAGARRL